MICDSAQPGLSNGFYHQPYIEAVAGKDHAYSTRHDGVIWTRNANHPKDGRCPECKEKQMTQLDEIQARADAHFIRAQAWYKGYGDCWDFHQSAGQIGRDTNPYRAAETQATQTLGWQHRTAETQPKKLHQTLSPRAHFYLRGNDERTDALHQHGLRQTIRALPLRDVHDRAR